MKQPLSIYREKSGRLSPPKLLTCALHWRFIARSSVFIMVFYLSACATTPNNKLQDNWFGDDKVAHFVLSGLTSAVIAKAAKEDGRENCDAAAIGLGVTLSLGAAKESYDKHHKKTLYSFKDMSWNLLGGTIGSLAGSNCR